MGSNGRCPRAKYNTVFTLHFRNDGLFRNRDSLTSVNRVRIMSRAADGDRRAMRVLYVLTNLTVRLRQRLSAATYSAQGAPQFLQSLPSASVEMPPSQLQQP